MTRSFYLAGRYSRRLELQSYAERLKDRGCEITSNWLFHEHTIDMQTPGAYTDQQRCSFALTDLNDVVNANELIYFTEDFEKSRSFLARRGGRHVELGLALGVGNSVHCIGPRENIFCYLPMIEIYPSFDEFLRLQF